ncbi:DNA mismatch repair endonuclease MutL [bacterium]|nr:DNA mismatch repair endonuclease MutL [bacterium]MBU1072427.1 DNA mismatch repair endonuclease MutL [bacterium]MBU1674354.1 DNA mismatch repair endonuclease MutL [bacterium]
MPRHPIRILDSASVDRIAAGEVIERPASVVKELAENALDAGAGNIGISITDGGAAAIVVEDDGEGIPYRELPLALERHATSKIISAADITQVASFGFRGEALASIASVSRCTVVSRTADEDVGGMIRVAGSVVERREPSPRNRGTTVTIEDLFYNTPARRKYLKTPQAEKKAVLNTVTTIALAYPEVRWRLTADGTTLLDLLPADSLPSRVRDLLGAQILEHLGRFERVEGGIGVGGLASRPTLTRISRAQQFFYVNRRPVESNALAQAVRLAYKDVIPPGRHPVVLLFLDIPHGDVDVNVHPTKSEVRLVLERHIFGMVMTALREGLDLRADPAFAPDDGTAPVDAPSSNRGPLQSLAEAQEDYLRRHFTSPGGAPADGQPSLFDGADGREARIIAADPFPGTGGGEPGRQAPFWQLHRTYICTQTRGGLLIIDQHNSHERILYNEARKTLGETSPRVPVQQLLFPVNLDLTPMQVQTYQSHAAELGKLGFAIQPFGGHSILVQGIPSSLKNWREGQLLLDVLDDLSETGRADNASHDDLLASYACHGAVRAGALMTQPEMQNLLDRLFATDKPLSCPHGRPTLIQFTREELEKRFGRR